MIILTSNEMLLLISLVGKDHKSLKTWSVVDFNVDEFLSDVSGVCWRRLFQQTDNTSTLFNDLSSLFLLVIEKHTALKEVGVSEKYCPWIIKDLEV